MFTYLKKNPKIFAQKKQNVEKYKLDIININKRKIYHKLNIELQFSLVYQYFDLRDHHQNIISSNLHELISNKVWIIKIRLTIKYFWMLLIFM